jgi:hypothetical protein
MTDTMLAPEMLAHTEIARELRVGDLAVFVDYKGRDVGARVTRIEHGTVWGRCCGLAPHQHGVYANGDMIVRDANDVRRAV